MFGGNMDKLDRELECMARRNFNFVMSMQRFSKFDKEEHENAGSLWRAYPDLQIAYLEEEAPHKQGGEFIHRCAHNLSAFSMSNDAQANQHTLGNFGFTVSRRASRTPRATSPNGSGYADHRRRRSGTPCGVLGAELESIVQQYQNRSISKLQACSQLVRRLESSVDVEEEAREQALGIYIAELDSIESVHRQVAEHVANAPRDENRPGDGANTFGTNERSGAGVECETFDRRRGSRGLEREGSKRPADDLAVFSSLINSRREFIPETGRRRPKFRIELPGNPILGGGKSDDQNHALNFYRGEYLQLIESGQLSGGVPQDQECARRI